jgi:ADP-heptose:LPS heptosyltransferase
MITDYTLRCMDDGQGAGVSWWWHRQLRRLPPRWFVRLRWPGRKPWQEREIILYARGGGIGDEMMCTAVFRAIKAQNPACRIVFLSKHRELHAGNPHIDELRDYHDCPPGPVYGLRYGPLLPPRTTLLEALAAWVGLADVELRLEPPRVTPSPALAAELAALPRPWIVVQPATSGWTPNKAWPRERWQALATQLAPDFTLIEIGTEPVLAGVHSIAGRTSISDLAWAVGQADVFVGGVSSGMHLAAAYGRPAVIVFGGYESPDSHRYANQRAFYSAVPCAPCWLNDDCPYERKCLTMIAADDVAQAVRTAAASGSV